MDKDKLYRFFDGNASGKEAAEVRQWFESSPENQSEFFKERKIFDAVMLAADAEKPADRQSLRPSTYRPHRKRAVKLRIPQAAALLVAVFVLGMMAYPYLRGEKEEKPATAWYETVSPLGAKSQITLTDGTKVWLNAGSRLLYSTEYGIRNREVRLEGEAYFEVAKNETLPFDVTTSRLKIRALGTAFNVKAYPGEATIEAILVEGKVEVKRTGTGISETEQALTLTPKQRITLVKETDEILFETNPKTNPVAAVLPEKIIKPNLKEVPATSDYMLQTSWKENRWQIDSEELGSLATKLARGYNVTIRFIDRGLMNYKFSGTLQDEPIEEVMRALSLSAPVTFILKGNEVSLSRNGTFEKEYKSLYIK